ncbi:MAG: beta strand repeat-containing protein, partial [Verrucomicrobiota bacterium]
DGTATLSVAASNSYSGGTVIGAGSLKLNASVNSMLGSGDVTIASGARLWDNNSGGDKVLNNNFNIADTGTDGGGVIFLNSGKALIIQGTLALSASAKIGTANTAANAFIANGPVDLGANTLTLRGSPVAINTGWAINGPITGTGGLDWSAGNPASTLRLAGTNNYSGGTAVSAVLAIASTNSLPGWDNASQYSISSGATLAVGNGVSDAAVATMLGTGNFAANAQIGFDTSAGPRTYASGLTDTVNGALGLTKVGNNTLTLEGANTYTGTTRINVGELLLNTVTALPGWDTDGRYVVANGATLAVGDSASDANVVTILATTNFNAGARIGFDTTAGDRTYGNILANTSVGSLGLTKLGNNTLNLPAANTYSGATVVNAGTLAVNGSLGAGAVTVASGGTLGGYGQINGAVTVQDGGTLKLGSTIGTLTISNALTLADNSITWLKLAKGSSPSNDLVQGIRTLTMGGTLTVTTNAGMALLAAGDNFQLFQATNYVGGFAAVNLPALASGLQWDTNGLSSGVLSVVSGVTPPPPAPTLSSLTRSGSNLVLVWNGGTNSTCTLLTATNVAQPLVTWSSVVTNTVGADGRSTNTLPINPAEPQRFYRLSIP